MINAEIKGGEMTLDFKSKIERLKPDNAISEGKLDHAPIWEFEFATFEDLERFFLSNLSIIKEMNLGTKAIGYKIFIFEK